MKNQLNYLEHIGKLTFAYYEAEYERVKARDARAIARRDHPCTNEGYDSRTMPNIPKERCRGKRIP
jgi:hypothetical protein